MKKFIFSTLEGWQVLTANEAYATYGRKGYHNLPAFKVEGKNILELRGFMARASAPEYEVFREYTSEDEAQKTLAQWVSEDDDNVVVYESLSDAEKSVRDSYEGEPEFDEQMTDLRRAVAGMLS